jgi:hypothetical protein
VCVSCASGSYAGKTKTAVCDVCEAGYYSMSRATKCTPCGPGGWGLVY